MTSIEEDLQRKVFSEAEEAKSVEKILSNISVENTRLQLNKSINELNDVIRTNELVRERGLSGLFYAKLKTVLANLLEDKESAEFWSDFEVLIKCLRNSAAAFKADVYPDELDIIQKLIDFIRTEKVLKNLTDKGSNDEMIQKCLVFVLQYFFNLSQGNCNLLNRFLSPWTKLSFDLITTPDVHFEAFSLASMILVNSCIDKKNENTLHNLLVSISPFQQIKIINRVFANLDYKVDKTMSSDSFIDIDQEEVEYLVDESFVNWSLRLVDFITGYKLFLKDILDVYPQLDIIDRISILKILKIKLTKKQHQQFMDRDFTESLVRLYVKAGYLTKLTESAEFEFEKINYSILVHMHLSEIKHLAYCISDMLTLEHDISSKSNLVMAQNDSGLLQNTCRIFKNLHENEMLVGMFDLLKTHEIYTATHANLKCELIRLIGILLFKNEMNQKLVAEIGVMDLIANVNLNMDVRNPFIREWSIIALKHILAANDFEIKT